MTKSAYRKWLDSLKPGDEVALLDAESRLLMQIDCVFGRTKREIRTGSREFSTATGNELGFGRFHKLSPVDQSHRAILYQREASKMLSLAISPRTPIPTLQAIELLLEWQHRESIATHVIELIHNITREDLPQ